MPIQLCSGVQNTKPDSLIWFRFLNRESPNRAYVFRYLQILARKRRGFKVIYLHLLSSPFTIDPGLSPPLSLIPWAKGRKERRKRGVNPITGMHLQIANVLCSFEKLVCYWATAAMSPSLLRKWELAVYPVALQVTLLFAESQHSLPFLRLLCAWVERVIAIMQRRQVGDCKPSKTPLGLKRNQPILLLHEITTSSDAFIFPLQLWLWLIHVSGPLPSCLSPDDEVILQWWSGNFILLLQHLPAGAERSTDPRHLSPISMWKCLSVT